MNRPDEREFFDTLGTANPTGERDLAPPPGPESVASNAPVFADDDAPTPPASVDDHQKDQAPKRPGSRTNGAQPHPPWQPPRTPESGRSSLALGQRLGPSAGRHGAAAAGVPRRHLRDNGGSATHDAQRRQASPLAGGDLLHEQLRASDLVATRRIPPGRGWRKLLYRWSFGAVNTGESPDEQQVRKLNTQVAAVFRGTYSIAVLGGKGGAGKTTITAAIGSMFASLRRDMVVAIDADPAQAANLAARIDPGASSSFREILADGQLLRYADVRSHVGQNAIGLDVLASNPRLSAHRDLDADTYTTSHERLERFYSLLIADCGVDLQHPIMAGVLGRANAMVMVASAVPDGAEGAAKQIDWLGDCGYRPLVSRLVLVINHIRGHTSRKDRKKSDQLVATLVERFSRWVPRERIFVIPFDPHIAAAGVVDLDQLRPRTRRRFLELSAAVASGFSTTTDEQ
ncbi:MAG: MinD/ParA family ATP-binding protein [Mycobacterium sp.]